jgi:O-antigen/teichoic acid export membrane protein
LAARGTEVVGKFGLYVLAARQMGAYESGLFFLCLTWVNLLSTAARLGLERAMARHVAAELAIGAASEAKRVVIRGLALTAVSSMLACIITLLVAKPAAVLVLGMFDTAAAVSAFSVAFRITSMVNTILISLAMISAPAFARHHRLREYQELRHVERQTRLLSLVTCLPLIAIMMIVPRTLLSLLGGDFTTAWLALEILSLGQIVNTLLPTQDMMLAMTGHSRALQRINLQQLASCCILCIALIPAFKLMGAAWLATFCLVQGRIGFAWAVQRMVPELSARPRTIAA